MSHYREGMRKAGRHDYRGAIVDYTLAIDASDSQSDIKSMATYNRALAYSAIHDDQHAAQDLDAVLKMPHLPERIKSAALRRQKRVDQRDARDSRAS